MIDISLSPLLPLPSFSNLSHCQRAKNNMCNGERHKNKRDNGNNNNIVWKIVVRALLPPPPHSFSLSLTTIVSLSLLYNIYHASEPHIYICNNIIYTYKVIVTQLNSNSCRYFQLLFVPLFPFLVYWTAFKLLTNATIPTDVIKFFTFYLASIFLLPFFS